MLRLRRYERISVSKSAISHQRKPVDPKFQVEGVTPTNHSSSKKTRLNYLLYGRKIWTDFSSVLSQSTRLTDGRTDGQTDRQTPFSSLVRAGIPCGAEKVIKSNEGELITPICKVIRYGPCLTKGLHNFTCDQVWWTYWAPLGDLWAT